MLGLVSCTGGTSHDASSGPSGARRETVAPDDALHTRVDEPLTFEVVIDPRTAPAASSVPGRPTGVAGAFRVGARVVVWVRAAGDDPRAATAAHFGTAEVRDASPERLVFAVRGRVPPTLWARRAGGLPGTSIATPAGRYTVVLDGFFGRDLVVDDDAPRAVPTVVTVIPGPTSPDATSGDPRVLGEQDLAGVAFGTDETVAMARLTARFGRPSFDEMHTGRCGVERLAGWGDLLVVLRAPAAGAGANGAKVFVAYRYSAPHAGTNEGPLGLATVSGLEPGMTIAQLRAREPRAVFVTDVDSTVLASWYASPGGRLAGRLSDDVTAADPAVVEVASSLSTLPAATLDDVC